MWIEGVVFESVPGKCDSCSNYHFLHNSGVFAASYNSSS